MEKYKLQPISFYVVENLRLTKQCDNESVLLGTTVITARVTMNQRY